MTDRLQQHQSISILHRRAYSFSQIQDSNYMNKIENIMGDLFDGIENKSDNVIIIPHVCNDIGKWGSGFVVPLGTKWPIAKESYLEWSDNGYDLQRDLTFVLGSTQVVNVQERIYVANMVAQEGIISRTNERPLKYSALTICMENIARTMLCASSEDEKIEIHCPKFGSDRAGGDWKHIENLIEEIWLPLAEKVVVYSFE